MASLCAVVNSVDYVICSHSSQRVIVRASNPGQFENEVDIGAWSRGKHQRSVVYHGSVGINTDTPSEALSVNGNIRVTGAVLQPSDRRIKENLRPTDTKKQLENVRQLDLVHFDLREPWARQAGRSDSRHETGVVAQQVAEILPEAIHSGGLVTLDNGEVISDLKIVNKERIFFENVGAVQELCKMTEVGAGRGHDHLL